jgi:putative flippase GtrA
MGKHFFSIQNEFIRFILVGVLNTAFGYGIYCLLIFVRFPYWWAVLISNICGVLFNFKTTGVLVFKSHNNRLVFRFIANYVVIFFINIGIVKIVLKYFFSERVHRWNNCNVILCVAFLCVSEIHHI